MSPNDSRSWHRSVSIRANDDRFQVIFDSVRDGIFIADPTTGRIIEANRAGCAMFDYSMDELIGGDIGMLSSGAPAYTLENAIEKHKKVGPGENITFEWQCKRRDGHLFWAEVSLSHATIGGIGSSIAIVRDISERKRLYEELQLCLESVSAASDAKAVFLANMSHELRTPLNAVIGFCELISMEPLGPLGHPRYREYVDDINKSGLHLLALVNDILDLSRIESGKAELDDREICIGQIIGEVCQVLELDVVKDGLQIAVNLPNDLPNVRADERRIIQILSNLLLNAIKFSPAPGTISLDVVEHADGITIWVRDNGSGIAKTDISKVMERFGQAESRIARKHAGTGLGLPLAKQLMELHGGTLMIESDLGRGTSVGVNFPVSRIVRKAASDAA